MAAAQEAATLTPLRGILPSTRFEAGYIRTTDPIGAFGTLLRQRVIGQDDFDPSRLNYPAVASNYTGAVVLEQPLFNADALAGRRAARRASQAAEASTEWTALSTRVDIVRAYYGATLAREKVATLSVSVRAAREHVRRAEAMARNGLVTSSDALLAAVKAGDVEAMLVEAEGDAANAILALATAMGNPTDTSFALPSTLPGSEAVRRIANDALQASDVAALRADVRAARAGAEAADADALRARSLYLPRLNAFARYDWNSALRPFGGDNNWSAGVMASWAPFSGAAEIAEARATEGRSRAADAMREGAEARARLEVQQTARTLQVALARLDIAERAVRQSAEAHRIVARKYEGGLAAVVELLDASAAETQSRLALAAARHGLVVSSAERRKALGLDPGAIDVLDGAVAATNSPD
jgi:outer membrane protein TolC